MREPQYMQGDSIARSFNDLSTSEVTCPECDTEQTIEVEESYSAVTREVNWFGSYVCKGCGLNKNAEGWYSI